MLFVEDEALFWKLRVDQIPINNSLLHPDVPVFFQCIA
jgi:hypothetical protein